jgi:hypothetical protein
MKRLLTEASLIMKPEGQSDGLLPSVKPIDGSGDFTFTRGSNLAATRIGKTGLIEKGRENLLLQSNQFDTTWTTINTSVTSGQSGYDGSSDAWLLNVTATGTYRRIIQSTGGSSVVTNSIYAKAGTTDFIAITDVGGAGIAKVWFNLGSGTIGTITGSEIIDAKIESIGNGWYRCSVAHQGVSPSYALWFVTDTDNTLTGTIGANVYIQNAQQELGLAASPYIETTTTTAQAGVLENTPRLNYTTGVANPYLLLEPSRTNLVTQSEYFGSATWGKQNSVGVNTNSHLSPEGIQNATELDGFDTSNFQSVTQYITLSAGTFTFSVFLKKTTGALNHYPAVVMGSTYKYVIVNSTTGTYAEATGTNNNDSVIIESWDANWWRVSLTNTLSAGAQRFAIYPSLSANGTSITINASGANIFFGAQLETGSYPTSYIPTYSVSATRAADSCSKTNASGIIGQTDGTLFVDFVWNGLSDNVADNVIMSLGAQSYGVSNIAISNYNGSLYARVTNGVNVDANIFALILVAGTRYKCLITYTNNDVKFYVNGVLEGSDTSVSIPAVSDIYLQNNSPNSKNINQSLVFSTVLTNAEAITLTTI